MLMDTDQSETLTTLASKLRTLFIKRKRQNQPKYKTSSREGSFTRWLKVAEACKNAGANPRDWVEAAFTYNTLTGGPYTSTLCGPMITKWYKLYTHRDHNNNAVASVDARVKFDFAVLRKCLERNIERINNGQTTLEELLMDDFNRLQPYVCVVACPDNQNIRKKYLDAARKQVKESVAFLDAIYACGFDTTILTDGTAAT